MRPRRYFFLAAILILILDRASKFLIIRNLADGQSIKILPDIFHITFIMNDGVAFGLLKAKGVLFIPLAVLLTIFITVYIFKARELNFSLAIALGLISGGALGNLTDRITIGRVVDFIDFRIWPVFNIADSAITIGVVILAWKLLIKQAS